MICEKILLTFLHLSWNGAYIKILSSYTLFFAFFSLISEEMGIYNKIVLNNPTFIKITGYTAWKIIYIPQNSLLSFPNSLSGHSICKIFYIPQNNFLDFPKDLFQGISYAKISIYPQRKLIFIHYTIFIDGWYKSLYNKSTQSVYMQRVYIPVKARV